jgi:hypothetical protein
VETILRITDISASPTSTRRTRSARADQGIVAQWLREQATPSAPRTIEASAMQAVAATESVVAQAATTTDTTSARPQSRCGEQLSRRSARIRSRSRSSRVPA